MKRTTVCFCSQASSRKELENKYGKYHILNSPRLNEVEVVEYYNNTTSLPKIYNKWIEPTDTNVVLVHDDVLIYDNKWIEKLNDALEKNDVIGLAGTASAKIKEPCLWHLMGPQEDHRGRVSHVNSDGSGTSVTHFGRHGRVLILDGLFLGFNSKKLFDANVKFDETNPCVAHFYDIDFSLSCNSKKLKLTTTDIHVVHNSHGLRSFTDEWLTGQVWFKQKVIDGKY